MVFFTCGAIMQLKTHQTTVELVSVIAAYNMVSRFLIALEVNPEDHPPE